MSDESVFPPERFANLMRDAGINSPEALMNMLRGAAQAAEAAPAVSETKKSPDAGQDSHQENKIG